MAVVAASPANALAQTSANAQESPTEKILMPGARSSEPDAMTAGFLGMCSKCETEREELKTKLEEHKARIDILEDDISTAEGALDVLSKSFANVSIGWLKVALWHGRSASGAPYYDTAAVNRTGYDKIIGSNSFNAETIRAVKMFQCDYYEKAADGGCNEQRATGWPTFLEARSAICEQGFKATDNTAYILAYWYANNDVFVEDLPLARAITVAYRANLGTQIAEETNQARKDFLVERELEARNLTEVIDDRIDDFVWLTRKERADMKIKPLDVFSVSDVCPRQIDVEIERPTERPAL
jgi:hypothetical protein